MNVIAAIDAARERWNVLEHPFYVRWEKGELTHDELARYAGEYRHAVVALARAARTARLHAEEEAAHISLWDDFAAALGTETREPLPETRCCSSAWAAADDELGAAAILYAIESGQPEISATKLRGLVRALRLRVGHGRDRVLRASLRARPRARGRGTRAARRPRGPAARLARRVGARRQLGAARRRLVARS